MLKHTLKNIPIFPTYLTYLPNCINHLFDNLLVRSREPYESFICDVLDPEIAPLHRGRLAGQELQILAGDRPEV
jgi:hypothetical protein